MKETIISKELRNWLLTNKYKFTLTGSYLIDTRTANDIDYIVTNDNLNEASYKECLNILERQQIEEEQPDGYLTNANIVIKEKDKKYNFIVCLDTSISEAWLLANNAFEWVLANNESRLKELLIKERQSRIEFFRSIRFNYNTIN